jgi:hypothetical protein
MQALIDFDGWRKWKDFSAKTEQGASDRKGLPSAGSTAATGGAGVVPTGLPSAATKKKKARTSASGSVGPVVDRISEQEEIDAA